MYIMYCIVVVIIIIIIIMAGMAILSSGHNRYASAVAVSVASHDCNVIE